MLRKDCTTVKDRGSSEIIRSAIATAEVPVLLRFVSKHGMDFNQISTRFPQILHRRKSLFRSQKSLKMNLELG